MREAGSKPRIKLDEARTIVRHAVYPRVTSGRVHAKFELLPGDLTKDRILEACEVVSKSIRAPRDEKSEAKNLSRAYARAFAARDQHRNDLGISEKDGTTPGFRNYMAGQRQGVEL